MSHPDASVVVADTSVGKEGSEDTAAQGNPEFAGFNSAEELKAAYESLKANNPGTQEVPKPKEGDQGTKDGEGKTPLTIEDEEDDGDQAVANVLKSAGLNQDDFTKEFAETGTLSEESFKKLESKGFDRQMVDVYLIGLKAQAQTFDNAVYGAAGGEAEFKELVNWAKTGLNADEKKVFNEAIQSGDATRAHMAVKSLQAQRGFAGKGGMLQGKTATGGGGPQPFRSQAEMVRAMQDPRYRTDKAYRADISERLRISEMF